MTRHDPPPNVSRPEGRKRTTPWVRFPNGNYYRLDAGTLRLRYRAASGFVVRDVDFGNMTDADADASLRALGALHNEPFLPCCNRPASMCSCKNDSSGSGATCVDCGGDAEVYRDVARGTGACRPCEALHRAGRW